MCCNNIYFVGPKTEFQNLETLHDFHFVARNEDMIRSVISTYYRE